MKAHLLVLPALAFAVAVTNANTPVAQIPAATSATNVYLPQNPQPVPPAVVVTPPEPLPPPQPNIVPPPPQPEDPSAILEIIEPEEDEPAFIVQNGFEGYIVPADTIKTETAPSIIPLLATIVGLVKLPKLLLALTPIFGNGFLLLGIIGVVGAAFCAFTPFCALTLFPVLRSEDTGIKSILESERLKPVASFIVNSIDKYREVMRSIEDAAAENIARKEATKSATKQQK